MKFYGKISNDLDIVTKKYVEDVINNLSIQEGVQGPEGPMGPQGPQGVPGKNGADEAQ